MALPANYVQVDSVLAAGLRNDFADTYEREAGATERDLNPILDTTGEAQARTETFGYFESADHPRRVDQHETVSGESFDAVNYTATLYNYELLIDWHEDDEADERLGRLFQRANEGGRNYGLLDDRIAWQIILGSTDDELLPTVPNAPDGAALYNATAGDGSDRNGISGGNVITGSGVNTGHDVRTDVFNSIERIGGFTDTKGQPLHPPAILDRGFTVFYNINNSQIWAEGFRQATTVQKVAGDGTAGATDDVATAAGVSNVVMDSGMNITLRPTTRITDNDAFIFLNDPIIRPLARLSKGGLIVNEGTRANSDEARKKGQRYIVWKDRRMYVVNQPLSTVHINN